MEEMKKRRTATCEMQMQSFPQHDEESNVKLKMDVCEIEDVTVIRCQGRIAYRDEALALSEKVTELLPNTHQLVLELSGVEMIDSAGLGELVVALMWAQANNCSIKLAAPRKTIGELLQLTNLSSVFEIYSTVDDAVLASRGQLA
jgi:anti-sigma B factor antagonist